MTGKGLGILGGTFDPIHIGHLRIAEAVYERIALEQIIFIPAFVPPHKVGQDYAPAEHRYAMTELAVKPYPHFTVSDMELRRSGVSYTIDTLRELRQIYPDKELYFIIGADSVAQLHTWNSINEMLQLATFVAAGRPGYEGVMEEVVHHLGAAAAERIMLLHTPEYDISSTEIRTRLHEGASLAGLVPRAVEQYIVAHNLYQRQDEAEMMTIDEMKQLLQASLPPKRYKHSVHVYETALELAKSHKLPEEKIAICALLHDCGREIASKESAAKADALGIAIDDVERNQPILLHAKLGVYYAQTKYGVTDKEILEGISQHTTGAAHMTDLAKVVFLADMIEPGRDFPGIEDLRKLAHKSLDKAMLKAYSNTIEYLLAGGQLIHPHCIDGYNELMLAQKSDNK